MWLITTLCVAIISTVLCIVFKGKYKFGKLSLMLWGATTMILVDHVLGYEGGAFLEKETDGLINNGFALGFIMLIPVLAIWFIAYLVRHTNSSDV